jgi:hypothetical protein
VAVPDWRVPVRVDQRSGASDLGGSGRTGLLGTDSVSGSIWDVRLGSDGRGSRREGLTGVLGFRLSPAR